MPNIYQLSTEFINMKFKLLLIFLITTTILSTLITTTPFSKIYGYENDNMKKQYPNDDNYNVKMNYKKDKPIVFLPDDKTAELGDQWWKWAYSINTETDINPFSEFNQEGCDAGLHDSGKFLFLIGAEDLPKIKCDINQEVKILFPIISVLCNSLDSPPFFGSNEEDQRECSETIMDEAFDLEFKINGYPVQDIEKYRVDSPEGEVKFTAAENNPFFPSLGEGTGVSDGFWILLKLPTGENKLSYKGSVDLSELLGPDVIFTTGASYHFNVIGE